MDILHNYGLPLVTLLAGVFSAYLYFRNNVSTISRDVIATYKERVEQLEGTVKQMQMEMKDVTAQLNKMSGMVQEKDDRIKTLESIIQNRSPILEIAMQKMISFSESAEPFMKTTQLAIDEIHRLMATMDLKINALSLAK